MAPLPPSNTARVFFDYDTGRHLHTVQIRHDTAAGGDIVAVQSRFFDFLTAIQGDLVAGWRLVAMRVAAQGSDITLPVDMSSELANFVGGGQPAISEAAEALQATWVGRSPTTGRRVRLSLYGTDQPLPGNFRFGPGETSLASAAAFAALELNPACFIAIDGSNPTWYTYVDVQYNSYWETALRG